MFEVSRICVGIIRCVGGCNMRCGEVKFTMVALDNNLVM